MSVAREQIIEAPAAQLIHRQEVSATVTRSCMHCGAGNNGESHMKAWQCHQCGKERPADEIPGDNGLLWRREVRTKGKWTWPWK